MVHKTGEQILYDWYLEQSQGAGDSYSSAEENFETIVTVGLDSLLLQLRHSNLDTGGNDHLEGAVHIGLSTLPALGSSRLTGADIIRYSATLDQISHFYLTNKIIPFAMAKGNYNEMIIFAEQNGVVEQGHQIKCESATLTEVPETVTLDLRGTLEMNVLCNKRRK